MIYRVKAMVYFTLSLLLCVVAQNGDDPLPLWLVGVMSSVAATLGLQAIRQLRLYQYYEGRRTLLVIDARRRGARRD
jgi:hypothetical protein